MEAEQPMVEALRALPPSASLQAYFDVFIRSLSEFWTQGERKNLLIDVFASQLRRVRHLAQDRRAELTREVMAERFRRAHQDGEVNPMMPPELLADFFLLNCMAAMASWCAQPLMSLPDTLHGVVHLFMQGAKPPAELPKGTPQ